MTRMKGHIMDDFFLSFPPQWHEGRARSMLEADVAWREEHRWKELLQAPDFDPLAELNSSFANLEKYLPIWVQGSE